MQISFLRIQQFVCKSSKSNWKDFSLSSWLYLVEEVLLTSIFQCLFFFETSVLQTNPSRVWYDRHPKCHRAVQFYWHLEHHILYRRHVLLICFKHMHLTGFLSAMCLCHTKSGSIIFFFFFYLGYCSKKEVKTLKTGIRFLLLCYCVLFTLW